MKIIIPQNYMKKCNDTDGQHVVQNDTFNTRTVLIRDTVSTAYNESTA